MAQKTVLMPGVGEVILAKRRGASYFRLSVTARGKVRVSMPYWSPYAAGVVFAHERRDWIVAQLVKHAPAIITPGMRVGKSRRVIFELAPTFSSRVKGNEVIVRGPDSYESPKMQSMAAKTAERALQSEAETLLPQRLAALAKKYSYKYSTVRVRKMTSRWGSCSSKRVITLSHYLMQLPWPLIDYVLVHELLHTKHMHHGPAFWQEFESITPKARQLRKQVNSYHLRLEPFTDVQIKDD